MVVVIETDIRQHRLRSVIEVAGKTSRHSRATVFFVHEKIIYVAELCHAHTTDVQVSHFESHCHRSPGICKKL